MRSKKKIETFLAPRGGKDYIKNPFSFLNINGDFSLMQQKILISIVVKLQDRIKNYLEYREDRVGSNRYDLFMPEEFDDKGKIRIDMNLSDIVENSYDWNRLEIAAETLSKIIIPIIKHDERSGGMVKGWHQLMVCNIPTTGGEYTRKNGTMYVEIDRDVAGSVLSMRHGYAEHIKKIINLCACAKSPKLYEYLSLKFRYTNECEVPYAELRKLLGATITVSNNGKYVEHHKYARFKDFNRRCLEPAYLELKHLFLSGQETDFYFEYEPIFSKRGNPDKILFRLINNKEIAEDVKEVVVPPMVADFKKALTDGFSTLGDNGKSLINSLLSGKIGIMEQDGEILVIYFNKTYLPEMFRSEVLDRIAVGVSCKLLFRDR